MAAGPIAERNQDATIYVGGLDEKVSETLLWELFLEGGPVGKLIIFQEGQPAWAGLGSIGLGSIV